MKIAILCDAFPPFKSSAAIQMGDLAKGIKSFKKGLSDDTNSDQDKNNNNSDNPDADNK